MRIAELKKLTQPEAEALANRATEEGDPVLLRLFGDYCELVSKRLDMAKSWYTAAVKAGDSMANFDVARVTMLSGDIESTRKLLDGIAEAHAESPVVHLAFDVLGVDDRENPIEWDSDDVNWGGANFTILPTDRDAAADVLANLGDRFAHVGVDGTILTEEEQESQVVETASWIAPVMIAELAVMQHMDVWGEMPASMGRTFTTLMTHALIDAGISASIFYHRDELSDVAVEWNPAG